MATLTIAQRREKQLEKFNNDYIKDIEKARYIINSYYRLCGLSVRNCELSNDYEFYTKHYRALEASEQKERRWIERLNKVLKEYNLCLAFPGIYPEIVIENNHCIDVVVIDCISY